MPRPLSNDLRIRMVNAVQNGESRHAVAERFDVAPSSVIKLMQAFEATGSHEPKRMGGYKKSKLAGHEALVCGLIAEVPDATLDELVARLRKARVKTSRTGLWRFLDGLGLSFKKRPCTPANRTGRTFRRRGWNCSKTSRSLIAAT